MGSSKYSEVRGYSHIKSAHETHNPSVYQYSCPNTEDPPFLHPTIDFTVGHMMDNDNHLLVPYLCEL